MKDTKKFLEQALRSLPQDYTFQSTRSHIVSAINQIRDVEVRRNRYENTQIMIKKMEEEKQKAQLLGMPSWQMSTVQAKAALKQLDKMINIEQSKIDKINKNNDTDVQQLFE